jgi:hypothetical protein
LKVNVHPLEAEADAEDEDGDMGSHSPMNMHELVKKQQQESASGVDRQDPYVNCNFIVGSTAAVERLWSVAKTILTCQQSSMTPMMFETILFLRTNRRFWDRTLILKAIQKAKSDRVTRCLAEEEEQEEMTEELVDYDDDDE